MHYHVFTDGTINKEDSMGFLAFMIHTDDNFITIKSDKIDTTHITVTETLAVGKACKFLLKDVGLTAKDKVTLYVDAQAAISYISAYLDGERRATKDERIVQTCILADYINKLCDLKFVKVKSHTMTYNGNDVADLVTTMTKRGSWKCLA